MPYHIDWKANERLLICRLTEAVDSPELAAMIQEAMRQVQQSEPSPASDAPLNICCDARDVWRLIIGFGDVPALVSALNGFEERHPRGRTAIVTTRPIDQAMAKLLVWKSFTDQRQRQQFTRIDDALGWLHASHE